MEERCFGSIRFIPGENRGRYPFCNSLFIENAGILIDPASDRASLIRLRDEHAVKMVWLSHWHEDHFTHLDLFDDLPLWVSAEDTPPLADLNVFLDWYGFNDQERTYWEPLIRGQFHYRPRKPSRCFHGGESLRLGDLTVDVIATPGHTPGHMAFFFREPSVLFSGDYDLTRFGPWYGDLYSDMDQVLASLDRLEKISARIVLTGHERGIFEDPPAEVWRQYGAVITERERKLLSLLDEPRTLEEITAACILYGKPRQPREFFAFGERVHMIKHLEHLMKCGAVVFENGFYRRVDS